MPQSYNCSDRLLSLPCCWYLPNWVHGADLTKKRTLQSYCPACLISQALCDLIHTRFKARPLAFVCAIPTVCGLIARLGWPLACAHNSNKGKSSCLIESLFPLQPPLSLVHALPPMPQRVAAAEPVGRRLVQAACPLPRPRLEPEPQSQYTARAVLAVPQPVQQGVRDTMHPHPTTALPRVDDILIHPARK
jgi:hypothetical protein